MKLDPTTQAYNDFITALDQDTRDAVTKLMLYTRTRPDDPQMLGVCLTAVATKANAQAQERVLKAQTTTLEALEILKKGPELQQGINRVASLQSALETCERTIRRSGSVFGLWAGTLALCWFGSMSFAWNTGYNWASNDIHGATHEQVCNDLNGYIRAVSTYWRVTLKMPQAADRLVATYEPACGK